MNDRTRTPNNQYGRQNCGVFRSILLTLTTNIRNGDLWAFLERGTIPMDLPLQLLSKWVGFVVLRFNISSSLWSFSVQVNLSARHGHLKPEDQAIIIEKAGKVRRLFDRINAIEVTVDLEHLDKPTVEINVSAEHSPDFVATAQAASILAALDLTIGKVEQQIRKHKEKVTDHKATPVKHTGNNEV